MRWLFLLALLVLVGGLIGCGPKKPTVDDFGADVDCVVEVNQPRAKNAPADKNAALKLLQAIGPQPDGIELTPEMLKWFGVEPLPAKGDYWQTQKDYFAKEVGGDDGKSFAQVMETRRTQLWKSADHDRLAEWLKVNAKPLAKAKDAAKAPAYYHPLVPSKVGDATGSLLTARLFLVALTREMCRALLARAMLQAGEGRSDDAWDDVLTAHRLALHLTRGLTVLEYVVGVSLVRDTVETELALVQMDDAATSAGGRRVREFVASAEVPTPAPLMDAHKLQCRDVVQHFRKHGEAYLQRVAKDEAESSAFTIPGTEERKKLDVLDWSAVARPCLENADALADAFKLPTFDQRRKAIEEVDLQVAKRKQQLRDGLNYEKADGLSERCGILLLGLLNPAGRNLNRAYSEAVQRHRNLLVAFALSAHHSTTGKYPEKLADLTPKHLKTVPDDLFIGEPMVYTLTEDGYFLSSVGANGKEDGGGGDDIGVRMPREQKK